MRFLNQGWPDEIPIGFDIQRKGTPKRVEKPQALNLEPDDLPVMIGRPQTHKGVSFKEDRLRPRSFVAGAIEDDPRPRKDEAGTRGTFRIAVGRGGTKLYLVLGCTTGVRQGGLRQGQRDARVGRSILGGLVERTGVEIGQTRARLAGTVDKGEYIPKRKTGRVALCANRAQDALVEAVHHPAGDGQVIAHVRSWGEASTKAVTIIINGIVRTVVAAVVLVMFMVLVTGVFVMLVMLVPTRRAQGGADRRPQAEEENEFPTEVERHGYRKQDGD
jgi:hypothetical protein